MSTVINNGVYVILELNKENMEIIRKLLKTEIGAYLLDIDKCCIDDVLFQMEDEECLDIFLDPLKESDLLTNEYLKYIMFFINTFESECGDDKKGHSYIYKKINSNIIHKLDRAIKTFINFGIPENDINFGYLY